MFNTIIIVSSSIHSLHKDQKEICQRPVQIWTYYPDHLLYLTLQCRDMKWPWSDGRGRKLALTDVNAVSSRALMPFKKNKIANFFVYKSSRRVYCLNNRCHFFNGFFIPLDQIQNHRMIGEMIADHKIFKMCSWVIMAHNIAKWAWVNIVHKKMLVLNSHLRPSNMPISFNKFGIKSINRYKYEYFYSIPSSCLNVIYQMTFYR